MPKQSSPARARLAAFRRSWALAPVLAGLAMLLQYIIDVPKGEILERESSSPAADADGSDADSTKPNGERPRKGKGKSKGKNASKSKSKPPKPRTTQQLEQLRTQWSARPLEDEPTDQRFRRAHEALLRSVATRARTDVLGEREALPMQIRPTCRTIRCALELCGQQPLIDAVGEALPRANVGGVSLWHELREVEPTRKVAQREAAKNYVCRRWIVDFAIENVEVGKVTLSERTPDEPPPAPAN